MTCPGPRSHEVTQPRRDPGCQDPNPTQAVCFSSDPTRFLHLVVLGMQVVGNKLHACVPKDMPLSPPCCLKLHRSLGVMPAPSSL